MRNRLNAFTASFAVHLTAIVLLLWNSPLAVSPPPKPAAARPVMIEWPTELLTQKQEAARQPKRPPTPADLEYRGPLTTLETDGFSYDFRKVTDRARSLFPFLSIEQTIEPLLRAVRPPVRKSLANPFAAPLGTRPPLAMNRAEAQALANKTWARRERWGPFQTMAVLTASHNLNEGDLPAAIRVYVEQNLLQPYVDTTIPDPRLWTMLGIAADHGDFIDYVTKFAAGHPSTRTTTELLFLLDQIVQGSRDALIALLRTDVDKRLRWTELVNSEAYRFLRTVHQHYSHQTAQLGLVTDKAIQLYYDSIRIAILKAAVDTTPDGYRANDARFLIGAIYWQQGRRGEALSWWRGITRDATDGYARASGELLDIIEGKGLDAISSKDVDRVLDAERARWRIFWMGRLREFGYRFDTF